MIERMVLRVRVVILQWRSTWVMTDGMEMQRECKIFSSAMMESQEVVVGVRYLGKFV